MLPSEQLLPTDKELVHSAQQMANRLLLRSDELDLVATRLARALGYAEADGFVIDIPPLWELIAEVEMKLNTADTPYNQLGEPLA